MATGIEVRDIKFYNQLHNGSDYLLNSSNYSTTLKGNVGDKVQFTAQIGVYNEVELSSYSFFNNTTYSVINMEGANFVSVGGFAVGNLVGYHRNYETSPGVWVTVIFTGYVQYVDENKIEIEYLAGLMPSSGQIDGTDGYYADVLTGLEESTASIYSFCINENDDPFNEYSIIDNTLQAWYNETITTSYSDGIWKDILKGQKNGTFRIKKTGLVPRNVRFANTPSVFTYEVQHEFIVPYWREDESTNLEDSVPISDLLGTKSYKYAFKIDMRTVLSNATTSKVAIYEALKGSVGYFDESFNGFSEYYSFSDLVLTDLSNSQTVTSLVANGQTKVNFRLSTTKANFTNTHKILLGHSYLGLEDEYSNTKTDFESNFMYDTLRVTCDSSAVSSLVINNATAVYVDASNIDVEFTIDYPTNYESRLSDETQFVLWCDVSDLTFYDNSDKIKLKLLYNTHSKDSDVLNLVTASQFMLYPHTADINNSGEGFTDYKGFVEDGIGVNLRFLLNNNVLRIDRMQLRLLAINDDTSDFFELFSRDINKESLKRIDYLNGWKGGYSIGLGYNLNTQDDLNNEELTVFGSGLIGGDIATDMQLKTGLKIPYQTWIDNVNVPNIFFDATKQNNNQNYLTSNYDVNDYTLRLCLEMDLITDGEASTTYRLQSNDLVIKDFAESDDYEMIIRTFAEDLATETFGNLIRNAKTIIRAEITQLSGDFTDLTGVWGIIRLEEQNQTATNNHELSSVVASYVGNPLIPLNGELSAKLEIVSGKIYLTCMVDNELLTNADYRISARLGINTGLELGAYSIGYSDGYN